MYLTGETYIDKIAARIYFKANPTREYFDDRSLYRVYALLALVVGRRINSVVTPQDVHDAWCVWKVVDNPTHIYLVPFDQLTEEIRARDIEFADAIQEVIEEGW